MNLTQQAIEAMLSAVRPLVGHAKTVPNFKAAVQRARRALCSVVGVKECQVFLVWRPPCSWDGFLSPQDFRFDVVTHRTAKVLREAGVQLVPFEWEGKIRVPRQEDLAERWVISLGPL